MLGKQHRHPIPASGRERAKQVGDAVHVDLRGPIGTEAIDKSFYFVLFKDEFSNFRIVYTVRTKDLVYDSIRKCVAQIESDTKKKVKCLVSDCGSENFRWYSIALAASITVLLSLSIKPFC